MGSAKSRIEINELGEFFIIVPDDVVEDLVLEEGERVTWYVDNGSVELTFG